jgi:hypothetical protein
MFLVGFVMQIGREKGQQKAVVNETGSWMIVMMTMMIWVNIMCVTLLDGQQPGNGANVTTGELRKRVHS